MKKLLTVLFLVFCILLQFAVFATAVNPVYLGYSVTLPNLQRVVLLVDGTKVTENQYCEIMLFGGTVNRMDARPQRSNDSSLGSWVGIYPDPYPEAYVTLPFSGGSVGSGTYLQVGGKQNNVVSKTAAGIASVG